MAVGWAFLPDLNRGTLISFWCGKLGAMPTLAWACAWMKRRGMAKQV